MLFVTGDTHGDHDRFFKENERLGAGDALIVCGDFGYLFSGSKREQEYLNTLASLPYQLFFVDGNHENFDLLETYPVQKWCGGNVHVIREDKCGTPKVVHLMRGQVFEMEGKKIFTFGGAYSIDKYMRTPGKSWWSREMPTDEEMKEAVKNLKHHHLQVDYIVTHAAPEDTMTRFHPYHPEEQRLNNFLEWVRENTAYSHWYFGHLHQDKDLWRNQSVLYQEIRNIETNERLV